MQAQDTSPQVATDRESQARFFNAFHSSPVGINIFRLADGRSIDVNDAFLDLVGYSRDEFLGRLGGLVSSLSGFPR